LFIQPYFVIFKGSDNWEEYRDGGRAMLEENGSNFWIKDGQGYDHAYLVLDGAWDGNEEVMNNARKVISNEIDNLLCGTEIEFETFH
jgi:hypothetical protein